MTNQMTTVYFSHSQVIVRDTKTLAVALLTTDQHFNQGYTRGDHAVVFRTLVEFGEMNLSIVDEGCIWTHNWDSVIGVALHTASGSISIEGVEEYEPKRDVSLEAGWYWVVFAQRVAQEEAINAAVSMKRIEGFQSSRAYVGFMARVDGWTPLDTAEPL